MNAAASGTGKGLRLAGLGVLLVGLAILAGTTAISGESGYAGLSPRFMPTVVGIGLAACGLLLALGRGRDNPDSIEEIVAYEAAIAQESAGASAAPAEPVADESGAHAGSLRAFAWAAGGLVAHLALIGQIGFVLASTLLMVCVARAYGSRRPLRDALVGLAIAVPVWLLFTQLLGLNLPLLPLLSLAGH